MSAQLSTPAPARHPSPTPMDRWLVGRFLAAHGHAPISVILWSGEEVRASRGAPIARVRFRDRAVLWRLLRNPDLALGDAYADGRLEVQGDVVQLVEGAFRAIERAPAWRRSIVRALGLPWRRNDRGRARANIHHHYDIGNEFYRLWLDDQLVYTCAYFPTPEASLEDAQVAKMDHVCRKLALRPDERVLEAGCGWGALALHMAEHYGVRVRAFNISSEQIHYAREQALRRGLAARVEFVEDDYRNIRSRHDVFVSVGMLEHVGKSHYGTLGRVIDRCLEPHGRGLIHSIGRAQPRPMNPWLQRRIFPGAYIPSLREMLRVLEPRDLAVLDVENLRLHYAKTLEHWLDRFEKAADRVQALFDARFVRMWRLYLVSSIAAFRTGSCDLYQVTFARAGNDRIPWTRAHIYEGS